MFKNVSIYNLKKIFKYKGLKIGQKIIREMKFHDVDSSVWGEYVVLRFDLVNDRVLLKTIKRWNNKHVHIVDHSKFSEDLDLTIDYPILYVINDFTAQKDWKVFK